MKLFAATVAIATVTAFSAAAMVPNSGVSRDLRLQGYSADVIQSLTADQLSKIGAAMHNGSDSEARENVAALINRFAG